MHKRAAIVALMVAAGGLMAHAEIRFTDASVDLLPMAALNGRSMDAEFADLDGDGTPELIVASEIGANVIARWDDGRWRYAEGIIPQGRVSDSEDIAVGDFDGDGKPDLCFATEDDRDDELYLSSLGGDGVMLGAAHDRLPFGGISNAVLAIDLNEDGRLDLIMGNSGPEGVWLNEGDTFKASSLILQGGMSVTQDIEVGDLDGDGDLDFVFANEDANEIFINKSTDEGWRFDNVPHHLPDPGLNEETREVDLADIDGDGDLDMFFANVPWKFNKKPKNRILINDGTGFFTDETVDRITDEKHLTTLDADFADIDGDGDLDLITANMHPKTPVRVYLNNGKGVFTDITEDALPEMKYVNGVDVEIVDLNMDGVPDIYVANHSGPDRALIQGAG